MLAFPDASPSFILAILRILSATFCQSCCPPRILLFITPVLNLLFTFGSFSFHHFIFFTDFGALLYLVQTIIVLTTTLCYAATHSPTTNFVSTTSLILRLVCCHQGCALDQFLTEFKIEFERYLQVRVQVRVLRILFFEFKFEFGKNDRVRVRSPGLCSLNGMNK